MKDQIGLRKHAARVQRHNGNQVNGWPTYDVDADWTDVTTWLCEQVGARGGETVRGRQTAAEVTRVLFGDYPSGRMIQPKDRILIDDETLPVGVVAALDQDGDGRELRVECKAQVG